MERRPALLTERLVLRPLTRDDIPAIVAGLNDYAVSKWLTVVPYPYGAADAEAFLAHLETRGRFDGYGLTRAGGPVMGVVGIDKSLGYWLGRAHHRQGYMAEAAEALVAHYFTATEADDLTSGHFEGNIASARILARLGFRYSHDERVHARAQGVEVTLKKLRLTRADREARRGY